MARRSSRAKGRSDVRREIKDTPERLVEAGQVNYGWFRRPFTELNLLDCDNWGWGGRSPRTLREFRLKEWQHFAIVHDEVYVSIALVDAKYLANSWVCVFDRQERTSHEHARVVPMARIRLPGELWDGRCGFESRGYRVQVHNHLDAGEHIINLDIEARGDRPAIQGEITLRQDLDAVQPLISVLSMGPGQPFYSHKAPCPVTGTLTVGDRRLDYDGDWDLALIDIHKAFYPRRTFWKWATFAGRDADGEIIGVNLTRNVIDDEKHGNENAIWHGSHLSLVGPARFDVPVEDDDAWRIWTLDQRVELNFTPVGMRSEMINYVLAESRYRQPFGYYRGHLVDDTGVRHEVDDLFGIAEDHFVTW